MKENILHEEEFVELGLLQSYSSIAIFAALLLSSVYSFVLTVK